MKKLYVGNLPWSVDSARLTELLAEHDVAPERAEVLVDRESGRSRGFGFVHFATDDEAREALSVLQGIEVQGRALVVNEAIAKSSDEKREKPQRVRPGVGLDGGRDRGRGRRRRDERDWD